MMDRGGSPSSVETGPPVPIGEVIHQKYRLDRVIGRGGIGVVVAAEHLQLRESVAIKFLLPGPARDAAMVARFLREARAAVRIRSEHVAKVLDVGTTDAGAPFMVMEHLEGTDLAALRRERRAVFGVEETALYVLQACEALAEAHVLGIVHRDLKPANLFLTTRPDGGACIKVLDFGISKMHEVEGVVTETANTLGSPLYMSPEQLVSARDVDARTDVWSLGAVLYELLTNRRTFARGTFAEICVRVLHETPPRPSSLRPDLPEALDKIVTKCLSKDRNDRYDDVGGLAAALAPFGGEEGRVSASRTRRITARSPAPRNDAPVLARITATPEGVTSVTGIMTLPQPASNRRRVWIGVGAFGGAAMVAIALAAFDTHPTVTTTVATAAPLAASTSAPSLVPPPTVAEAPAPSSEPASAPAASSAAATHETPRRSSPAHPVNRQPEPRKSASKTAVPDDRK